MQIFLAGRLPRGYLHVRVQTPIAAARFAHALAILPRSDVYTHVDRRNRDERCQIHEHEVDDGVDGVEEPVVRARLGGAIAEMPEAGVVLRNGTEDPEDGGHNPSGIDEPHASRFADVEVITQRVDHCEVLIDPYQQDAEDGRGADQAGAALCQITHVVQIGDVIVITFVAWERSELGRDPLTCFYYLDAVVVLFVY